MKKRILSCLLVLVMAMSLLPVNVFAKLDTGHKIDVTFTVLYVGDEFRIGYNYGASEKTQFVCQYTTNHSDTAYTNHTIAISDIKAAADRATVDGYQIVGWSKESNANPKIWGFNLGSTKDTACNKGTTIYLVAKDPTPAVKYTLNYDANGGTGAPGPQTAKSKTGSATFTISDTTPTLKGYDFQGWADNANGTGKIYQPKENITVTATETTLYAVWEEHEHKDNNGDGFCDDDNTCVHPKDDKGNCKIPDCTHPDSCCPKPEKPDPAPTEPTTKPSIVSDVSVRVQCADESKAAVHGASEYGLPDFPAVSKSDPQYKDNGMVKHEDGSYTYSITLLPSNFLSMYNNTKLGADKTPRGLHFIVGQTGSTTIEWKWEEGAWVCQTPSVEGKDYGANVKLVYDVKSPDVAPTGFDDVSVVVRDQSEKHTSIVFGAPWVPNASHYVSTGYEKNEDGDLIYTAVINPQRFVDKYNNTPNIGYHRLVSCTGTELQWRWGETGWETISEDIAGEAKNVKIAIDVRCLTDVDVYIHAADSDGEPLDELGDVTLDASTLERVGLIAKFNEDGFLVAGTFQSAVATAAEPDNTYFADDEDNQVVADAAAELKTPGKFQLDAENKNQTAFDKNGILDRTDWRSIDIGEESSMIGNLTFYSVVFDPNTTDTVTGMPAVKYTSNGRGVYDYYLKGETVVIPSEQPTRSGYEFRGWELNGVSVKADNEITVNGDLTITATWTKKTTPVDPKAAAYKVEYYLERDDGSFKANATDTEFPLYGEIGSTVTAEEKTFAHYVLSKTHADSVPSGKVFAPSKENLDENGMPKVLTLKLYYVRDSHLVKFDTNGGSAVAAQNVKHGKTASEPANPTKEGYVFRGWYNGSKEFDFGTTKITEDITLTAKWDKTTDPVTPVAAAYQVEYYVETADGYPTEPNTTKTLVGKLDKEVTADTTAAPDEHHVFDAENKDNVTSGTVTKPELVDGKLTNMLVLKVYYKLDSHTVTFNADNGTKATTDTVKHGGKATAPTAPTKSGYNFNGWYNGDKKFDFDTVITEDITLTAQWTKRSSGGGSSSRDYDYTLRYVTNGGKAIASETKSKSWTKDYEDLPMPTRAGYRFDGWYYDSALKKEVTGDVKVNSSTVTLYAGWTASTVPDSLNGEDHFAYIQGYADGTVRPNTPVTRAQVATILFRLLDESVRKEYLTESNTFTDVASNYWANTAISTMANMGVFKGRTADRFDPNAPITRGEFAAVCARFDDSKVKTTETYSDIDGYWAADEILRAAALGWVQGYQDGSYRPNNSITRAQVVTMINRVLCRMPEENADLLKDMTSFTDCAEDDWCYLAIQEATNSHDYKTKSGSIHEKWTDLNTAPDWSKFEH